MGEEVTRSNGTDSVQQTKTDEVSDSAAESKKEDLVGQNRETFDTPVLESRPPNYLLLAICTTLFINPVLGIIALVIAIQADNEYIQGNTSKSRKFGQIAKILCIVAIVLTTVIVIILSTVLNT